MTDPFHALSFYTLTHPGKDFIHQHAVDAYTAQTAHDKTKPIAIAYALAGLYLYVEEGFSGWEVQNFHIRMTRGKSNLPAIVLPQDRGRIDIHDVLNNTPGPDRDLMIAQWCASVWDAYADSRDQVVAYIRQFDPV